MHFTNRPFSHVTLLYDYDQMQ